MMLYLFTLIECIDEDAECGLNNICRSGQCTTIF